MTKSQNPTADLNSGKEDLTQKFYSTGRFYPLFLGVMAVGFLVIYLLTRFNLLGETTPQFLYLAGAVGFSTLLQYVALSLARFQRGAAAYVVSSVSITLLAILLTAFWEGMWLVASILVFIVPVMAIRAGIGRIYQVQLGLSIILGLALIWFVETEHLTERLQNYSTSALASIALLGTTALLLLTVTVITRSRSFQSLRGQLLVSFIIIVAVPTLLTAIFSAIGAYSNIESQTLILLETVSSLKENQVNQAVENIKIDGFGISTDSTFLRYIGRILTPDESAQTKNLYKLLSRARLQKLIDSDKDIYREIMVMSTNGEVIISTDPNREGKSYTSEAFFRIGSIGSYIGFSKNPTFGDDNLVFSTPLYDKTRNNALEGVLVLRITPELIKNIIEQNQNFKELDTYLLDKDFYPLTKTRTPTQAIHTQAAEFVNANPTQTGSGIYENYAGDFVMGYYQQIESLNLTFITEIPRSYLIDKSIKSLLGSSALTIFAIAIAIAAVIISAGSISEPISTLARTAESFAAGKFFMRARLDRRDEIGALGKTYDQMAEQLQDMIGKLEQRVADRTKELEDQTLRLKTSAEIARDAASSRNLKELLNKAGSLIQERLGFYHTGIFLLDNNNEYAVLTASPTRAGQEMIANNHKLRVGEMGIVGRVAATGEPRISLDVGEDAVHFNNPYLPETRSEMALPLKAEDKVIGVLDVQSQAPQAFDENDIAIMQILADQLATAIERTRLFQQVEENLNDLEIAYGQFTRDGWRSLADSGILSNPGYRFDNIRIQPIKEIPELGNQAMETGLPIEHETTDSMPGGKKVAIPIKLRGQTIGVVEAALKDGHTQSTVTTLELAIERLALSLESARLYEEARLRADREQTIAQIASSISATTDFDAILRTTVEQVGKALSDSEVSIHVIDESDK